MKKLITIIGVLLLLGAVIAPVMAWGPGRGHHMMGYWDNDPEYGRDVYGNLTSEQRGQLDSLDRKFYDETRDLQNLIWAKSRELDSVLAGANPEFESAKGLQKEISELRAKLDEATLNYELEARKILPDQRLDYAYGGRYGHHMRASGRGMGYGQGSCWN